MKKQNIPLFDPTKHRLGFMLEDEWTAYVNKYFKPSENTHAVKEALEYNISKFDGKLSLDKFKGWDFCLHVSDLMLKNKYSSSDLDKLVIHNLNRLFEQSDKSIDVQKVIELRLVRPERRTLFLNEKTNNKNRVSEFKFNLNELSTCLYPIHKDTPIDNTLSQVLDSIYSEAIYNQFSDSLTDTSVNTKNFQFNYLYYADMLFDNKSFLVEPNELDKLIPMLGMVRLISTIEHEEDCDKYLASLTSKLESKLKSQYPDAYNQYNALESLGIKPALKELKHDLVVDSSKLEALNF